jgi:hypothetical protein
VKRLSTTIPALLAVLFAFSLALMPLVTEAAQPNPAPVRQVTDSLDAEEIADLQFMREEEKLARDVYTTLDDVWGVPIFRNISRSEQSHMDAVLAVMNRYGIPDPVGTNVVGGFTNPDLQSL